MVLFDVIIDLLAFDMCGQVNCAFVWLPAAIGAAAAIGNGIFGSVSANKQKRDQLKEIEKQQSENKAWYNRRYNEDATQRANAQRMLTRANEAIRRSNQVAAGKQAVIGGTDANLSATQEANAKAVGEAMADIAVAGEERKDVIEADYRSRQQSLDAQRAGVNADYQASVRQNLANAATGAIAAGASAFGNTETPAPETQATTAEPSTTKPASTMAKRYYKPQTWEQARRERWGKRYIDDERSLLDGRW